MRTNVPNEIVCNNIRECRRYSTDRWDCLNCRNNKYVNPVKLKKDYYKPKVGKIIVNMILILFVISIITMLGIGATL